MELDALLKQVTPEIYQRMKRAVETGRWPDGAAVTAEQRENCLAIVIAWDQRNLPEDERTGWLPPHPKAQQQKQNPDSATKPLRFADQTKH